MEEIGDKSQLSLSTLWRCRQWNFLCSFLEELLVALQSTEVALISSQKDQLVVVSASDCRQKGPGFDARLYRRNVSGSIGSVIGSTQS